MQQDGSSSSQQTSQGSPQQQQESGRRRDQTAEGPRDGERPEQGEQPGQQDQQGQQPQPDENGDPNANQQDRGEGQQLTGSRDPEQAVEDGSAAGRSTDVWGNLPIHLQDIFRAEGGGDLPAQYRDWIDAYYRRLNDRASD